MAYATVEQLTAWLPADFVVPADATRLLESASRQIDTVLVTAVYDTDDDGIPTDTSIALAFQQAACAQASWWIETGDEQGVASTLSSASIGGPSWSGSVQRTSPDALEILRRAVDSGGTSLFAYSTWMP